MNRPTNHLPGRPDGPAPAHESRGRVMPFRKFGRACAVTTCCGLLVFAPMLRASERQLVVAPASVSLTGNFARAQLLVSAANQSGQSTERSEDLTAAAQFESTNTSVVRVSGGAL